MEEGTEGLSVAAGTGETGSTTAGVGIRSGTDGISETTTDEAFSAGRGSSERGVTSM